METATTFALFFSLLTVVGVVVALILNRLKEAMEGTNRCAADHRHVLNQIDMIRRDTQKTREIMQQHHDMLERIYQTLQR
jgi:hypothetical protein